MTDLIAPLSELRIRTHKGVSLTPPNRPKSVTIQRSALIDLLRNALPEDAVMLGSSMMLHDLPTARAEADLIVGADGVGSSLRREIFGDRYLATRTGTTVWRGTARGATTGLIEYWGERQRFGVSNRPGEGTNWYATAVLPAVRHYSVRRAAGQPDVEELRYLFGHWAGRVAATVEGITEGSVLRHDIQHLKKRLPRYYQGNVVLVGDAAHAVTPDLGRGANEALLDALSLARSLRRQHEVSRSLVTYDRLRRPPTQLLASASSALDTLIHRHLAIRW